MIKAIKDIPVAVGFGIKNKADVDQILTIADGAIVGTSLVKEISKNIDEAKQFLSNLYS